MTRAHKFIVLGNNMSLVHGSVCWVVFVLSMLLLAEATPTCPQRYRIAPTCKATAFASTLDSQAYLTEQSVEKVLCLMNQKFVSKSLPTLNGLHFGALWESYRYARELSIWIYRVLGVNDSIPLNFAFYPTRDGNSAKCMTLTSGPYIKGGGGAPLCRLIHEMIEQGDGSAIEFLTQALDYGYEVDPDGNEYFEKWKATRDLQAQVRRRGFEPIERFLHGYNTRYVYDPTLDEFGQQIQNDLAHLPRGYFGMSGGGGSGAGFEIFCKDAVTAIKEVIVTGGGGGNAGMSSGDRGSLLHSYGVGNGGIDLHINGKTVSLQGFAGKVEEGAEYGKVISSTTTPAQWKEFALTMKKVMAKIQKCHNTPGKVVTLEGGGGGGGGLATYRNADGVELEPHALDVGYQFQFALGTVLRANADNHEIPFLICPHKRNQAGNIPYGKCIETGTHSPSSRGPTTHRPTTRPRSQSPTKKTGTPVVTPTKPTGKPVVSPTSRTSNPVPFITPTFKPVVSPTKYPAGQIAQCEQKNTICDVATFVDEKGDTVPYKYQYTGACMCYVNNLYDKAYLSPPPKFVMNCSAIFYPPVPDPNAQFKKAWCKGGFTIKGCPSYPLCK